MRTQSDPRFRKRMTCRLQIHDTAYTGLVLNLSRGGLFVQTSARSRPGDGIQIDLSPHDNRDVALSGHVVWKRIPAARLQIMTPVGVGLRIERASEAYYQMLMEWVPRGEPTVDDEEVKLATGPENRCVFRVRVMHASGPRSRVVTVAEHDEEAARRRALAEVGDGWVILDISQVPGPNPSSEG